jgi:hypothetical protein
MIWRNERRNADNCLAGGEPDVVWTVGQARGDGAYAYGTD